MPKLEIYAACENVLFDDQQNPTLVGVFCALDVASTTGASIANNALAPRDWMIATMWLAEDSDIGREFSQKLQIIAPNGTEYGSATESFTMSKRAQTVKIKALGLPIGVEGYIVIKVWLESLGTRVGEVHEYHISISHKRMVP